MGYEFHAQCSQPSVQQRLMLADAQLYAEVAFLCFIIDNSDNNIIVFIKNT